VLLRFGEFQTQRLEFTPCKRLSETAFWFLFGDTLHSVLGVVIYLIEKPYPSSLHTSSTLQSCPIRVAFYASTVAPLFFQVGTFCAGLFQLSTIVTYSMASYDGEIWELQWLKKKAADAVKIKTVKVAG
jgi:hypothetical protein